MFSELNPQALRDLLKALADHVAREILEGRESRAQTLILTHDELSDLTDYKTPAKQIQWLQKRGWTFERSASGRPKVDRTYYLMKMGVDISFLKRTEAVKEKPWEPDWEAFARSQREAKLERERKRLERQEQRLEQERKKKERAAKGHRF